MSATLEAPVPAIGNLSRRFTLDGDGGLESRLNQACARVVSGIRGIVPGDRLEAVLLGGGYGRGEGGVLRSPDGDRPYNDLEFYVAIHGGRHRNEFLYGAALDSLAGILTHLAGVEVEFRITSAAELADSPVSMFSHDLAVGHRPLYGEPALLDGLARHCDPRSIPRSEATRLLMNRGTGLLLARRELQRDPLPAASVDFIRRNIAKAQLACGDAILASGGLYHSSARERHSRLVEISKAEPSPWFDSLVRLHGAGVGFKLHPEHRAAGRDDLETSHAEVTELALDCWLWVESRRLGRSFCSARDYVESAVDKCPERKGPLNPILNLRASGWRPEAGPAPWRHPRERVFNALCLLLWEYDFLSEAALRDRLGRELGVRPRPFPEMLSAYEALWRRVR